VIKLAPVAPPAELSVAEASERDLTRSELIDSFVTEEGAFAPAGLAALIDRTPFLREGSALSSAADHGIARPR
jgi:hypothetical protein